jgi:hypothetical protein
VLGAATLRRNRSEDGPPGETITEEGRPSGDLPRCRGGATQQTGDAQVFIDVGPVDALAVAEKLEIRSLGRGSAE